MFFTKFRNFNVAGVGEVVPGAMAGVTGAGDVQVVSEVLTIRFHWYIFYNESVHIFSFHSHKILTEQTNVVVVL